MESRYLGWEPGLLLKRHRYVVATRCHLGFATINGSGVKKWSLMNADDLRMLSMRCAIQLQAMESVKALGSQCLPKKHLKCPNNISGLGDWVLF